MAGRALPLILVALLAMAAGAFAFQWLAPEGNSDLESSAAESDEQLAALQDALTTSLALPLDFRKIEAFELLDKHNQPVSETIFDNRWSLMFFGYTHCPDVCPITLHVMKNVVEKLAEQGEPAPQVVFVSVDPARDTSDVMKQYIGYFNDEFVGITGDRDSMHQFTRSLGVVAAFTANKEDPENYIVDHTASLLLIDPQRRVRAKITPPHEADAIVADYLTLTSAPG